MAEAGLPGFDNNGCETLGAQQGATMIGTAEQDAFIREQIYSVVTTQL